MREVKTVEVKNQVEKDSVTDITIENISNNEVVDVNYVKVSPENLTTKGEFYSSPVYIRPFNVREIVKLSSMTENNASDVINSVMTQVVKGVKWNEIYSVDKTPLILWVRANTYKRPEYKIPYTCRKDVEKDDGSTETCNGDIKLAIHPNEFEMKYVSSDFVGGLNKMKLPSGLTIISKLSTVSDEQHYKQLRAAFKKKFEKKQDMLEEDILMYISIVKEIYFEQSDSIPDAYKDVDFDSLLNPKAVYDFFAETMEPADYIYFITKWAEDFDFGVEATVKTSCKKCGVLVEIPVTFSRSFFIPDYTTD